MTKIGEGGNLPQKIDYHKELDNQTTRFQDALFIYQSASSEDREHLKTVMDESLRAIGSTVSEIKRAGIYKQEKLVEKDYQTYINSPNNENFQALAHDIETLKNYNQINP